jgi:phosphoribosyl 1,2-cyclic phosphodiesterase
MNNHFSIRSLASGSRGNCWILKAGSTQVLIDAGISSKQVVERLESVGESPEAICGMLLTHEHSDHANGIPVLSRRFGWKTWAAQAAVDKGRGLRKPPLSGENGVTITPIEAGEPFVIGELTIRPFSVSHDSADPVMFVLEYQSWKIGFATDLGIVTRLVRQRFGGLDALVIESNHDEDMLMNGPYRPEDKRRIKSRLGHLSNTQAQELAQQVVHPGLQYVALAHLSQTNNDRTLAYDGMCAALNECGHAPQILVARQDRPGCEIIIKT